VYLSVETMLNLAALLLVISLGCSMLVPSEPGWSDDDDVFFLGSATAAPSVFAAEVLPVTYLLLAAGALAITIFMLQRNERFRYRDESHDVFELRMRLRRVPTAGEITAERQRLEALRARGRYIRRFGFSPVSDDDDGFSPLSGDEQDPPPTPDYAPGHAPEDHPELYPELTAVTDGEQDPSVVRVSYLPVQPTIPAGHRTWWTSSSSNPANADRVAAATAAATAAALPRRVRAARRSALSIALMFLLTMAVPGDAAIVQNGADTAPSFGLVYGLMALVAALATALVFVMFQRKLPLDDGAMRCWICDRTGHVKSNCPERVVTSNGPPKVKKQRVRGPTVYIEGVHARCELMVDGVRCDKHHLRRDCEEQPDIVLLPRILSCSPGRCPVQPPMAVTVDVHPRPHIVEKIVWIESPYSAANVQFLKSHYARWCSDRNCWYMLAASSAATHRNLDAVLERFGRCSEPSRTDDGKFKKSTCTKPCYMSARTRKPSHGRRAQAAQPGVAGRSRRLHHCIY
jgi:hypothetical protein